MNGLNDQSQLEENEIIPKIENPKNWTEEKIKEQLLIDIGWGFNDRGVAKTPFNHYFSSVDIPNKKNDVKVSVITVFNDLLVIGLENGTIIQWSISTMGDKVYYTRDLLAKRFPGRIGHTARINGICYCKQFAKIVTTSEDNARTPSHNLIVWNYGNPNDPVHKIHKSVEEITSLCVTTVEKSYAVFATSDRKLHIWDFQRPNIPIIKFKTDHTNLILSLGVLLGPAVKEGNMGIISVGLDKKMIRHVVHGEIGDKDTKVISFTFEKGHVKSISCLEVHFPWIEKTHTQAQAQAQAQVQHETHNRIHSLVQRITDFRGSQASTDAPNAARVVSEAPILLTGSLDNTIIIWDYETTTKIKQLIGHEGKITAIKVSDRDDDGSPPIVISASTDQTIRLWDLVLGRSIRSIRHNQPLIALAVQDSEWKNYAPKNLKDFTAGLLLFSTDQQKLLVWDLRHTKRTKKVMNLEPKSDNTAEKRTTAASAINNIQTYQVYNQAASANEQKFLIGCENGEFHVRSFKTFKDSTIEKVFTIHENRVANATIYQPLSKLSQQPIDPIVISGDGKGKVVVWSITNLVGSDTAAPVTSAEVGSDTAAPVTSAEVGSDTAAPVTLAEVGSDTAASVTSAEVGSDTAAPVTSAEVGSDTAAPGTSAKVVHRIQGDRYSVMAIGLYNPNLFGSVSRREVFRTGSNSADCVIDLSIPCVLIGGKEKMIRVYDFTNSYQGNSKLTLQRPKEFLIKEKESHHHSDVRSIAIFHPTEQTARPLFITADSYGTAPILWDLETMKELRTFSEGLSYGYLTIYYPNISLTNSTTTSSPSLEDEALIPAIAGGGNEGKVSIWNLVDIISPLGEGEEDYKTKQKIAPRKSFQAHDLSITALSLCNNPSQTKRSTPLLISGSIDKLIRIWNFLTGEHLHTLIGHLDRVNALRVYHPPNEEGFPILFSGGNDEQMIVWEDALYDQSFMPLREIVRNAFIVDYQSKKGSEWPLISSLVKQYGYSLFVENSQLFVMAVNYARSDFLLQFFDYLVLTLPTMRPALFKKSLNHDSNSTNTATTTTSPLTPQRPNRTSSSITSTMIPSLDGIPSLLPSAVSFNPVFHRTSTRLQVIDVDRGEPSIANYERLTEHDITISDAEPILPLDILHLAICKHDLLAVQTIVLAWLKNLNQDMESVLVQRLYHPMYYLSFPTMKSLYEYYPSEFQFFISHLQLIRNHDSLLQGPQKACLTRNERMEFRSSNDKLNYYDTFWEPLSNIDERVRLYDLNAIVAYPCLPKSIQDILLIRYIHLLQYYDLWSQFFRDPIPRQPVTSLVIPFCTCKELLKYLDWFVDVSNQLDDVSIFNSEIVIILLRYFWVIYGRRAHILAFFNYLCFFGLFLLTMYSYEPRWHRNGGMIFLNICTLIGFFYYGYEEMKQFTESMMKQNNGKFFTTILKHIYDLWNFIDVVIIICGICGICLRFQDGVDTPTGRGFLAITSVAMWFKILYFLRPFATTGPLVAMILLIAHEIVIFLIILMCLLAGFAQGFWLLSNNDKSSDFGTVSQSLYNSFLFMIGQNVDTTFNGIDSPYIATILLIGFFLTMTILMLNLLIALMGDVFSKARQRGTALWRREQAAIILEQKFLYAEDLKLNEYLLVLKYSSEVKKIVIDYEALLKEYKLTGEGALNSFLEKEQNSTATLRNNKSNNHDDNNNDDK